jgi:hypothetical protein
LTVQSCCAKHAAEAEIVTEFNAHARTHPQRRSSIAHTCRQVYFGRVRVDIEPSFENHSDMVSAPPGQLASADRSKVVERDEKIYREKPEFI